jgi:tRNA(fMet)-specific endonuclease VapC
MTALLDTDILSEVLKSKDRHVQTRAGAYLIEHGHYTLSTVTIMVVTLDKVSAELAGRIYADLERDGRLVGIADVLIASIAIHLDLTLVTGNTSDYSHIQAIGYPLRLENWRAA